MARKSKAAEPVEPVEPVEESTAVVEEERKIEDTAADVEIPADDAAEVQTGGDGEGGAEPPFSAQAVELAQRYGLDANDFTSEQSLYRTVSNLDRAIGSLSRQSGVRSDAQTGEKPDTSQQQVLTRLELKKLFPQTPDEEINPVIVNAWKALDDHYHGHIAGLSTKLSQYEALQKKVDELEQYRQTQESLRFEREWDGFFAGAPEEYQGRVGKGPAAELLGTPSLATRLDIVSLALSLKGFDEQRGLRPLADVEYGRRAMLSILGPETNAIARKQILAKASARNGAALAGTNGKTPRKASAEERAWNTFKEKANKMGLKVED